MRVRYMYHATMNYNVESIMAEGLKPGFDGVTYMCRKADDTIKFVGLRCYLSENPQLIAVIRVDLKQLESDKVSGNAGCS